MSPDSGLRQDKRRAARVAVVGVGSPLGWDRVGWDVVELLRGRGSLAAMPGVFLVTEDRPGVRLLDVIRAADFAVVIDAAMGPGPAGTVFRVGPEALIAGERAASTHQFGVAEVLALGSALGERLPPVCLIAVSCGEVPPEAEEHPPPLDAAVEAVEAEVARALRPLGGYRGRLQPPGHNQ